MIVSPESASGALVVAAFVVATALALAAPYPQAVDGTPIIRSADTVTDAEKRRILNEVSADLQKLQARAARIEKKIDQGK